MTLTAGISRTLSASAELKSDGVPDGHGLPLLVMSDYDVTPLGKGSVSRLGFPLFGRCG